MCVYYTVVVEVRTKHTHNDTYTFSFHISLACRTRGFCNYRNYLSRKLHTKLAMKCQQRFSITISKKFSFVTIFGCRLALVIHSKRGAIKFSGLMIFPLIFLFCLLLLLFSFFRFRYFCCTLGEIVFVCHKNSSLNSTPRHAKHPVHSRTVPVPQMLYIFLLFALVSAAR